MSLSEKQNKGSLAEEALKRYFTSLGFFVTRGVKFRYQNFDVTDIDLWLYNKETTLSRDIINVDIKNKRTPQAIERIFWTKGLQNVLNFNRCIVVTTDKRPATREFGESHDVVVLDGNFLSRLINNYIANDQLSEEEIYKNIDVISLKNSSIKWLSTYDKCKSLLISNLNYNGANLYLNVIHEAAEEYLLSTKKSEVSLRILYETIAFFMLCIDYKSRLLAPLTSEERKLCLIDGFRFGESGKQRASEILETAIALAEHTASGNLFTRNLIKKEVEKELSEYPAEDLAIFFSRSDVLKELFNNAKKFHFLAFAKSAQAPDKIDSNLKAYIGLFCDHFKINRKLII